MRTILTALFHGIFAIGCSGSGDADKGGEAKMEGAKAEAKKADDGLKKKRDGIKASIDKAKTSDDFLKITVDCGGLEIKAATDGKKLAENAEFKAVCTVAPVKARAQMAVKESTPDKMSTHCLSASMGVEGLIEKGIEKDAMTKLLADVNKACGM